MTTTLEARPETVNIGLTDGAELVIDHTGVPLGVYLAENGVNLAQGDTPVIGGEPVGLDVVLEPGAEVTVVPFNENG